MKAKWNMFFTGWFVGAFIHLILLYPVCDTIKGYEIGVTLGCLVFSSLAKVFTDEI